MIPHPSPADTVLLHVRILATESLTVVQDLGVQLSVKRVGGKVTSKVCAGCQRHQLQCCTCVADPWLTGSCAACLLCHVAPQFLDKAAIRHVIINEGITMCTVVFYMAFLMQPPAAKLIVAFEVRAVHVRLRGVLASTQRRLAHT